MKRWSANSIGSPLSLFIPFCLIQYRMLLFCFSFSSIKSFDGFIYCLAQFLLLRSRRLLLVFVDAKFVLAKRLSHFSPEHLPQLLDLIDCCAFSLFDLLLQGLKFFPEYFANSKYFFLFNLLRLFAETLQVFSEFEVFSFDPTVLLCPCF